MGLNENKAMSRRLYEEVFGRGNLAAADEIMRADAVSHGPGTPPVTGTEQIKRQSMLLRTAMPDLAVILNDQVAEDERVASRWTGRGTHSGTLNLMGTSVAASGREIVFDEIRIDRYADGKIVESWFIPDRFTLWQQLGLRPSPAG